MKLREKIWLWGQTPGSHHFSNMYNLPGENKMTPREGAEYLGIKNVCRVKMYVDSKLSFDKEMDNLADMDNIIFSVIGSGSCDASKNDLDEIIDLAKKHKNIVGGVMDDFVSETRLNIYTPEKLREMRVGLHSAADRPLDFWAVIYERDLIFDSTLKSEFGDEVCGKFLDDIPPRADEFDGITFWTWYGEKLWNYKENFAAARAIVRKNQKFMLGLYMYDYGNRKPLDENTMKYQLDFVYDKLISHEIDGVIICSNCIADLGLPAVYQVKDWIKEHGDEEI